MDEMLYGGHSKVSLAIDNTFEDGADGCPMGGDAMGNLLRFVS